MRCKGCGAKWSLEDSLGPGGEASPGQYLAVSLGVAAIALVVWVFWSSLGGALFLGVASLVFLLALSGCGYREPTTAYQGSTCPECGRKNWIWPWHF
jgi:hypothetical protein